MNLDRAQLARKMAQADAELNGVRPDFFSFRSNDECRPNAMVAVKEAAALQAQHGATFWRATQVADGVWIEGWRTQPAKQAPFDPPMTLEPVR